MRPFRVLLAVALLASMVATGGAVVGVPQGAGDDHVAGELIVGLKPGANLAAVTSALSGRVDRALLGGNGFVLSIPGNPKAMAAVARALPGVAYAEPNWIRVLHDHSGPVKPNDTDFGIKWDLHNDGTLSVGSDSATHGADANWLTVYDQLKVASLMTTVVAILDTGIDASHPDLNDKLVGGWDFISNDPDPQDGFGHGTHVAGIAAAETNNSQGTAGVGFHPAIKIMPIKVCDDNGSCPSDAISNGITFAANNGAKVINLSLGGSSISTAEQIAINDAHSKGVLIVASAGNSNTSTESYPAAYEPVMAIAATNWDDLKASYSNYGATWVDLAAPGGQTSGYDDIRGIYSTMPTYNVYLTSCRARGLLSPCYDLHYDQLQGTSMAAPQVAGAAGILFAMGVTSPTDVRNLLQGHAEKIPGTGSLWANGRLDLGAAVAAVAPPPPPPDPGSISGTVTDADTGFGIDGATVTVDGTEMSTTTATDGSYTISDVPVGDYTVTAAASGYVSASQSVTVSDASTATANFSLVAEPLPPPPGAISGTVTNADTGFGIDGATVTVDGTGLSATTGGGGSYNISDVPAGGYTVIAAASGYVSASQSVTVTSGVTTSGVDFALEAATVATTMHIGDLDGSSTSQGSTWTAIVSIRVVDANGNTVSSATVKGSWSSGATGESTCTTDSGGWCPVSKPSIAKRIGSVTFSVTGVIHDTLTYNSSSNTDPDGDSNGTTIVVAKP